MNVHIDSPKVAATASGWDTENLSLTSASDSIGGATPDGFTPRVKGVMGDFLNSWKGIVRSAANTAEKTGDDLRTTAIGLVRADEDASLAAQNDIAMLEEQR
jgi:hypothetical protein